MRCASGETSSLKAARARLRRCTSWTPGGVWRAVRDGANVTGRPGTERETAGRDGAAENLLMHIVDAGDQALAESLAERLRAGGYLIVDIRVVPSTRTL